MNRTKVWVFTILVLLLSVYVTGNGIAQNEPAGPGNTVLFNHALIDQIVEIGHVDRFVPGHHVILDDIMIRIPLNTPVFDDGGKRLESLSPGSTAGISRDPETKSIVAIIKLSKKTLDELVKKRTGK